MNLIDSHLRENGRGMLLQSEIKAKNRRMMTIGVLLAVLIGLGISVGQMRQANKNAEADKAAAKTQTAKCVGYKCLEADVNRLYGK
jgi:hypothetical protein